MFPEVQTLALDTSSLPTQRAEDHFCLDREKQVRIWGRQVSYLGSADSIEFYSDRSRSDQGKDVQGGLDSALCESSGSKVVATRRREVASDDFWCHSQQCRERKAGQSLVDNGGIRFMHQINTSVLEYIISGAGKSTRVTNQEHKTRDAFATSHFPAEQRVNMEYMHGDIFISKLSAKAQRSQVRCLGCETRGIPHPRNCPPGLRYRYPAKNAEFADAWDLLKPTSPISPVQMTKFDHSAHTSPLEEYHVTVRNTVICILILHPNCLSIIERTLRRRRSARPPPKMASQISKKRKFVADGVFRAELGEFFTRELAEEGYSGCEVRVTHARTEVSLSPETLYASGFPNARLNFGNRLSSVRLVPKMYSVKRDAGSGSSRRLSKSGSSSPKTRSICMLKRCRAVVFRLLRSASRCGTSYWVDSLFVGEFDSSFGCARGVGADSPGGNLKSACYGVLRFVMESGAKGCEVVVSGKLRAARAKSMKFTDGFMIHSGQPARDFVDYAVRHVLLRQGVLGIKVKIMKGWDPTGNLGPKKPLPDTVTIQEPPIDKVVAEPTSEHAGAAEPISAPAPAAEDYGVTEEATYGDAPAEEQPTA
ncbi:40S ribosomal protein S3 [Rhizoctonia solani AG-1 IA]|uniref:Small ribosomal subunit protein uS3 n=1 Tax=Thanatephorus cucumeris (strain AG1-IA) TaxID=983506 RepID=L8WND5_THACA|nr:40S ribosomal protein S3 [Rhizoctonia solani AG-1 IA]